MNFIEVPHRLVRMIIATYGLRRGIGILFTEFLPPTPMDMEAL
jgi:hypothetical protein